MPKIFIKKAEVSDIPALLYVEEKVVGLKTYSAMITEKEWTDELNKNNAFVYIIYRDDAIVGDVSYEKKSNDSAYISGFAVMPLFQGQGIGREVMKIIMDELKDVKIVKLLTHPENSSAIKLYLSFGFIIKAWKDNYYRDSEPRIELIRESKI